MDQGDDAGVPAGASGPDTGILSAGPSETGALVGGDHSRASAGASCPDTEPRPDASSSSVPASGALSLLGKQLPPVPSSTLRTSLDTEVPVEQRLQDPVTYSFAEDGNILLTNVMAGLPCLPKKLAQPLRSIQVGEIVELCLKFDVSKLTPPAFARIVEGTLRIHCLGLEELIRMGFNQIPWDEAAVQALLNKLRDTEATHTLRWFSKRFGLLDVASLGRLQEKRKALQDQLTPTVSKPQRKAMVPLKEVIWALECGAAGIPPPTAPSPDKGGIRGMEK